MLTFLLIIAIMCYWGMSMDYVVHLFMSDEEKQEKLLKKYGDNWVFWAVVGSPIVYTQHIINTHFKKED